MKNKKDPSIFDIKWNEKYRILVDFKKKYGHCNVPDKTIYKGCELGRWVIRQRVRKHKLSPERITKLNSIGFIWNIYEFLWIKSFGELKDYKAKFGHCDVSKGHKGYLSLAHWVINQRKYFKKGKLSKEQIKELEELGIVWEKYKRTPWEESLKKLKAFKAEFGHCNVTRSYKDMALGNWVSIQRRDKSKLTNHQVSELEKLGFCWKLKPGRKYKHFV